MPLSAQVLLLGWLAQVLASAPAPHRARAPAPHLAGWHHAPVGRGEVFTFPFDDERLLAPRHHDAGGVWVSPNARPGDRLPLFIYLHGLNRDQVMRRWLHASRWDLRAIVGPLVDAGRVGPVAVAVPATTGPSARGARTIYPDFDPAAFVEATDRALEAHGFRVDRGRVILSAHSASGCAPTNGLLRGVGSAAVQTILDIDCCMDATFARLLGRAPPEQRVIVAYQDNMWVGGRRFADFERVFRHVSAAVPEPANRVVERYDVRGVDAHNDIVPIVLRRWLPALVPP